MRALARQAGAGAIVDATGAPLKASLAGNPAVVKPNRAELGATVGLPVQTDEQVRHAAARLIEMGAGSVVVTMGAEGAMAVDARQCWRIRVPKIAAVNTIGSGDAFTGGLAVALSQGRDLPLAACLGAACGAANALTLLAGEVHPEDVRRIEEQVRVTEM